MAVQVDKGMARGCMGKHGGEKTLNESSRGFIQFCIETQLLIDTFFFLINKAMIDYFIYRQINEIASWSWI